MSLWSWLTGPHTVSIDSHVRELPQDDEISSEKLTEFTKTIKNIKANHLIIEKDNFLKLIDLIAHYQEMSTQAERRRVIVEYQNELHLFFKDIKNAIGKQDNLNELRNDLKELVDLKFNQITEKIEKQSKDIRNRIKQTGEKSQFQHLEGLMNQIRAEQKSSEQANTKFREKIKPYFDKLPYQQLTEEFRQNKQAFKRLSSKIEDLERHIKDHNRPQLERSDRQESIQPERQMCESQRTGKEVQRHQIPNQKHMLDEILNTLKQLKIQQNKVESNIQKLINENNEKNDKFQQTYQEICKQLSIKNISIRSEIEQDQVRAEISTLKSTVQKLKDQIDSFKSKETELKYKCKSLEQQSNRDKTKINQLYHQIQSINLQNKNLTEIKLKFETENICLKAREDKISKENNDLYEVLGASKQLLKQNKENSQRKLAQKQSTYKGNQQKQLLKFGNQRQKIDEYIKDDHENIKGLDGLTQTILTECTEIKTKIDRSFQKNEYVNKITQLSDKIRELSSKFDQLKKQQHLQQKDLLLSRLIAMIEDYSAINAQRGQMQQMMKQIGVKILVLLDKKKELESKLDEKTNQNAALLKQNQLLKAKLPKEQQALNLKEMELKLDGLANQNTTLKNQNQQLKAQLQELRLALQDKVNQCQKQIDSDNPKIQSLQNKEQKQQEGRLKSELQSMKRQLEQERTKINDLSSQLKSKSEQLQAQVIKLSKLEIILSEKSQLISNLTNQQDTKMRNLQSTLLKLLAQTDKLQFIHNKLSSIRPMINNLKKLQSQIPHTNRYDALFQNQILENQPEHKIFLVNEIQKNFKRIVKTKLLYRFDCVNDKTNFHKYIDFKANLIIIIRLMKNHYIAAFTDQPYIKKQKYYGNQALLFNLTKKEAFRLKNEAECREKIVLRPITYDDYHIIFGNSEIRLKTLQNKIFSNFGIAIAHFQNNGKTVDYFLHGGQKINEVNLEYYQIYQIQFEGEQFIEYTLDQINNIKNNSGSQILQ